MPVYSYWPAQSIWRLLGKERAHRKCSEGTELECCGDIWENVLQDERLGDVRPAREHGIWLNQESGMRLEMVGIRSGENDKREEWAVGKKAGCFHKRNLARLGHSLEGWTWGKMICKRCVRTKSWSWMLHWGVGHCRSKDRGVIWTLCVLLRWLCNGRIHKD